MDIKNHHLNIQPSSTLAINENTKEMNIFRANESVNWSLVDSADSALFSIDETTGLLTFNDAPDYEDPMDSDSDNKYSLGIRMKEESYIEI